MSARRAANRAYLVALAVVIGRVLLALPPFCYSRNTPVGTFRFFDRSSLYGLTAQLTHRAIA